MTYKLNSIVRKFLSPVLVHFGDNSSPDRYFKNGTQLAEEVFEKNYLIESISAQNDQIILTVVENKSVNTTNWAGGETVSFF
jgi:hypothetical protein